MKKAKWFALAPMVLVFFLGYPVTIFAAENPYQIEIDRLYYKDDSGREIDYDFSSGTIDTEGVIAIPDTAVKQRPPSEDQTVFVWLPPDSTTVQTVELDTAEGVFRMSVEQADSPSSEPQGLYAIGANQLSAPASGNWEFEVRVSDFQTMDLTQRYYDISVGAGRSTPGILPSMSGGWFTGTYKGKQYDKALYVHADIDDQISDQQSWESGLIFEEGLDPSTTILELRVQVQNGNQFTASYQINSQGWNQVGQHSITEGQMLCMGADALSPFLQMSTGIDVEGIPYPAPIIRNAFALSHKGADGSVGTSFIARPSGPSPEDISTFTVSGPSGTYDLAPATSAKELGLIYAYTIPNDIVDDGYYTFVLTDSFGRGHSVVKNFAYDSTVPGIDSSSMTPQNQAYVGTTTPTLSFNGVSGGDFYYRVYVVDYTNKVTYCLSPITQQTSFTVPSGLLQPNSPYWWFVRVWDRENDPQNVVESERRSFFTGTKGDPSSSEIYMASIDQSSSTTFFVRNTPVAPWDISQLTVTDPNSNVYGFQNSLRCGMNEPARYQIFVTDPFPMPDGVYTFVIKADVGDPVTKEHTFSYAPVPLVSEASRDPNENHYFSTKTPTFSWDPVGGAGIYYKLFIFDYFHAIPWYTSPWSASTSVTVPEAANLLAGSSYKWRIYVYDGNTSELLNNISLTSTRRTFTILEPSCGNISGEVFTSVTGQSEGVVGAKITIVETGQTATSDANGDYIVVGVPMGTGTCTVKIEKNDFETVTLSNVEVLDGQTTDLAATQMSFKPPDCGLKGDVDDDGKIGLEEAIHALQVVSGMNPE